MLFDYARITAPFAGVVTQRYANQGALMQAGTSSSTQAMPLVRLSQDNLFRLVIPVPESYVKYIHIGDPVQVRVPSLDKTFPGKVARFSVDVNEIPDHAHRSGRSQSGSHPGARALCRSNLTLEQRQRSRRAASGGEPGRRRATVFRGRSGQHDCKNGKVTLGLQTANHAEVLAA